MICLPPDRMIRRERERDYLENPQARAGDGAVKTLDDAGGHADIRPVVQAILFNRTIHLSKAEDFAGFADAAA